MSAWYLWRRGSCQRPPQGSHHLKEIGRVLAGELGHARAAVGEQGDEAFASQHLEGLAQRSARDAEELAEVFLRDFAAWLEPALHDHVADARHGFVVERGLNDLHVFRPLSSVHPTWTRQF